MYHKNLEAYKLALDIATDIYKLTENFPDKEKYNLVSQMCRCAISILSNIAEGCARFSKKETSRFINISLGSIAELDTQLIIANRLGYIEDIEQITQRLKKVNALTIGLKNYLMETINEEK